MNSLLIKTPHKLGQFALIAIFGWMTGYGLLVNPTAGLTVVLLPLILIFACSDKRTLLYLLIVLLPFHASSLVGLHQNIMGVPGAKPYNLLALGLFVLFFYYRGRLFGARDAIEKKTMIILGIHYAVYLV